MAKVETHTVVVLREFKAGEIVTIDALEASTGLPRPRLFNALCRLVVYKQIVRAKRGFYSLADNPPALPPKVTRVWAAKPVKTPRVIKLKTVTPPKPAAEAVASVAMVSAAIASRHPLATVWGA